MLYKVRKNVRVIKFILIILMYLFMLIEGFIGGTDTKDIWDDLVKWAKNKVIKFFI